MRIGDAPAGRLPIGGLGDVFPPYNPFLPDLLLRGHYGDLTIAALSTLVMTMVAPAFGATCAEAGRSLR